MEFGAPHLSVREPIDASSEGFAKVQRILKRRRVFVVGDWHFWVKYGEWKISTADGILDSNSPIGSPMDDCLRDLEGQKLLAVEPGIIFNSGVFKFDLGGILLIWPSTEIADDQWTLHSWNGNIAALQHNGALVFEKAADTVNTWERSDRETGQ